MTLWEPDRAAGLVRLADFAPRMGRSYSDHRNTDLGPGRNDQVSRLSPWIRHRLLTEDEVVRAALDAHGPRGADKFIQEVIWRTYWKGWLEMRPEVWTRFEAERARLFASGEAGSAAVQAAEQGRTGIEGFDDWARELVQTGWLHNHARMWFASIWIFTLGLPWVLGADFFMRHLMDGDPASNTLSWRWVAGLQTPGRTYLATGDNIARFTNGRFQPKGLASVAVPVSDAPSPSPRSLLPAVARTPEGPHLLLITVEDMTPEDSVAPRDICGVVSLDAPERDALGTPARQFRDGAMADTRRRAEVSFGHPVHRLGTVFEPGATAPPMGASLSAAALIEAARAVGAQGIVTPFVPCGPTALLLVSVQSALQAAGLDLVMVRRPWDSTLWPLADRGFFPFRERSGAALRSLGLPV